MLSLRLLGEIEVARDGALLALPPSRKTRALLAYLAATGRPHRRERLCALLWEIPDDPRGALRWSLSRLRTLVDDPGRQRIIATRDTVGFDATDADIDLIDLRTQAASGFNALPTQQLQELAASFRGEFLEGSDFPDLHDFQAWCVGEREDLRRLQGRMLSTLVERLGDQEPALTYARQLVQIDPFNESARASLLRLLLALGRRGEAEQHFEAAGRLFKELGKDAEASLIRTWRQLREEPRPPVITAEVDTSARPTSIEADAEGPSRPTTENQPNASSATANSEKYSIAVLPFDNLSDDSDNDYFSYRMTEDIIRLLACNRWLTVISRHSTVAFKGRSVDVREIGDALGVRYIVVGSVRKIGDSVRITAELVRAADGMQLWTDVYEFKLSDIFDIQAEMARQIAATIEPELSKVEQRLAARKAPDSLDAWECYQRGLWHLWAFTTPGFDDGERFFRRAISIEPGLARAHAGLGYVNVQRALQDDPRDRAARIDTALQEAQTSVDLDDRDCLCRCVLGRTFSLMRRNVEASEELELAIELNPSFAQGYFAQGFNLLWLGQEMEAETLLDRSILLSPRDSHLWSFHQVRSWVHFSLDEKAAAIEFARRATRQSNATYSALATLTAALGHAGMGAEAAEAAARLMERKPNYTGETARQELFFCANESFIDRFVQGLHAAGIPKRRA